jgi:catechol 2,3-dioxygenase-like lactoylglutathione lyase family enzyme
MTGPLRGLAQLNLPVADVRAARDWYSEFLGIEPYFQRPNEIGPAYVEFRIGERDDELGIIDRRFLPSRDDEAGGAIVRWHVNDLRSTVDRLIELGAREYEPIVEREAGFATASVLDPFGNVLGLIHSPHFLGRMGPARSVMEP